MFFCVLKDELFAPEDELYWADGQIWTPWFPVYYMRILLLDDWMNALYVLAGCNTCCSVRQIAGCLKFRVPFLGKVSGFDPSGQVADRLASCVKMYRGCRRGDWKRETWHRETIEIVWRLTSRDWTTRHHIARVDIARPDKAAPYRKGGHRDTWFIVRVEVHYKLIFAAWRIIWAPHRLHMCSFT